MTEITNFKKSINEYKDYVLASEFLLNLLNTEKLLNPPISLNWDVFFKLLVYHRLLPFVKNKIMQIPKKYKAKFDLIEKSTIQKNFRFEKLMNRINSEFNKNKIDFLFVKGASNLNKKRYMDDLDILINKEDISKTKKLVASFMDLNQDLSFTSNYNVFTVMTKDNLVVEFKQELDVGVSLNLENINNSPLRKELLFCFEAYHAVFHNSFSKLIWYYDGYIKLKNNELSYSRLFKTAEFLKISKILKTYIYIIHKLFHLKIPKKYFNKEDIERVDVLFKLNNPLFLNKFYDLIILESFSKIAHSNGFVKKTEQLFSAFIKELRFFPSKKIQLWFFFYSLKNHLSKRLFFYLLFPKIFYKKLTKNGYLWSTSDYWKLKKDNSFIPYHIYSQMDCFEGYLDLFALLILTHEPDLKKQRKDVAKLITKKNMSSWISIGKKYNKETLILAWFFELGFLKDDISKKWHTYFGFKQNSNKNERLYLFRRKIVLRESFKLKLFYFKAAIFPSYLRANKNTLIDLLMYWSYNLTQIRVNFHLFISLFKKIH